MTVLVNQLYSAQLHVRNLYLAHKYHCYVDGKSLGPPKVAQHGLIPAMVNIMDCTAILRADIGFHFWVLWPYSSPSLGSKSVEDAISTNNGVHDN